MPVYHSVIKAQHETGVAAGDGDAPKASRKSEDGEGEDGGDIESLQNNDCQNSILVHSQNNDADDISTIFDNSNYIINDPVIIYDQQIPVFSVNQGIKIGEVIAPSPKHMQDQELIAANNRVGDLIPTFFLSSENKAIRKEFESRFAKQTGENQILFTTGYISTLSGSLIEKLTDINLGIKAEDAAKEVITGSRSLAASKLDKIVNTLQKGVKPEKIKDTNYTIDTSLKYQKLEQSGVTKLSKQKFDSHIDNVEQMYKKPFADLPEIVQKDMKNIVKLDKYGRIVGIECMHRHHIGHKSDPKIKEIFKLADVDIKNDPSNLMFLPTPKAKEIYNTDRSHHQGRHTDESKESLYEAIEKSLKNGRDNNWGTDQYKSELFNILKDEREALRSGERILSTIKKKD